MLSRRRLTHSTPNDVPYASCYIKHRMICKVLARTSAASLAAKLFCSLGAAIRGLRLRLALLLQQPCPMLQQAQAGLVLLLVLTDRLHSLSSATMIGLPPVAVVAAHAAAAKGKKKGPGSKSNSSSDTAAPGRGRRARLNPNLRVPLPRLKGRQECLIKVSYLMRLQGAAGVWVFTHNASWVPPAHEWHVAVEPDAGSEAGWGPSASSAKHKRSPKVGLRSRACAACV